MVSIPLTSGCWAPSARSSTVRRRRAPDDSVEIARRPTRIELSQEQRAPLLFLVLTDGRGARPQALERTQEPTVGVVGPTHEPGASPSVRAQPVEPAVIADAKRSVRLDVITPELPETRPRVEKARPARDH